MNGEKNTGAIKGGNNIMLSINNQRKIYDNYKNGTITKIGKYYYTIAHNACASIHTFIIRSADGCHGWRWLQPLDKEVK